MANNYYSLREFCQRLHQPLFLILPQGHMTISVSSSIFPILLRGRTTLLSSYSLLSRVSHSRLRETIHDADNMIGWKRLLFADGPRQVINALTLYSLYLSKEDKGPWYDVSKYFSGNTLVTSGLTVSTAFTVLVFAISVFALIVAGICYIPLLCYIQGNLKVCSIFVFAVYHLEFLCQQEYCCHKVDKVSVACPYQVLSSALIYAFIAHFRDYQTEEQAASC